MIVILEFFFIAVILASMAHILNNIIHKGNPFFIKALPQHLLFKRGEDGIIYSKKSRYVNPFNNKWRQASLNNELVNMYVGNILTDVGKIDLSLEMQLKINDVEKISSKTNLKYIHPSCVISEHLVKISVTEALKDFNYDNNLSTFVEKIKDRLSYNLNMYGLELVSVVLSHLKINNKEITSPKEVLNDIDIIKMNESHSSSVMQEIDLNYDLKSKRFSD